ncbi:histidine phosphatase family protein [Marinomonas pollencensis]|uniref:Alpha-ribazole phosphatase n=1 Tax=Marinomonas pollencensis TaxID=491954 RepID=A0A3E0DHV3_9GAMM|nr:histidine phosphatase family protein [Marinomonas pollencensis]REG81341.1 alpha-ribazole phosphatase [Marinomonas pollencensis]
MKLYLIRHPRPDVEKGLCYGQTDVPLAPGWMSDAAHLSQYLEQRITADNTVFYHSPLKRAAKLASFISQDHSRMSEALKELDFGLWEKQLWRNIPRESIDLWFNNMLHAAPYQGESLQALANRVWGWWLARQKSDVEHLVVVTHAGVIKVLVSLLCQWPLEQAHRIDVGFMSVTELYIQDDYISLKRLGAGDWVL